MIGSSFIIVALISMALWIIYRLYNVVKNKRINIAREIILFIFFVYFLFLLLLTIFKGGRIEFSNQFNSFMYREHGLLGIINIVPIKETINTFMHSETGMRNSLRNLIGNILVFMPLGFFIPLLFDKFNNLKKVLKVGCLSSLAIELSQLFVGSNVCDIDDVIYNTLGALAGFICYKTFETIIKKVNLKNKLDKIRDFETNNILKKTIKGISIVIIVSLVSYVYAFYNQTMSAQLSDEEMAKKAFDCSDENIIDIKEFNGLKFYLIKDEVGLEIRQINKYILDRYIDSHIGYSFIENEKYGYRQEFIYNGENTNVMSPIVYGKNTNASKVIMTVRDKTIEQNLKKDDYFMVIYPEFISFNEDEIRKIYSSEVSSVIDIKFVDDKNKEVNTISDLAEMIE
ncbi:MAG: VanZ family protein [Clostridiales bacterium]|nr:VanZ family protein [Clostridiales bacterium]